VRDATLQDDGAIAQREAHFVERVDVEREAGFGKAAAAADLFDRERLEDHDLAMQLSENLDALAVSLFVGGAGIHRSVV
jgi:hypothetical protein